MSPRGHLHRALWVMAIQLGRILLRKCRDLPPIKPTLNKARLVGADVSISRYILLLIATIFRTPLGKLPRRGQ